MNLYGLTIIIRRTLEVLNTACDGWLQDDVSTPGLQVMVSQYINGHVYASDFSIETLEVVSKCFFTDERGN